MKNKLMKAFENYKHSVEVVISLYKKGLVYTDCTKAWKQIDEYTDDYRNMVNGMLMFSLIDDKLHTEAFNWLINYEVPSLF